MIPSELPKRTPFTSIVFADNDKLILEAIGELLRSKNYDVHLAHDGREKGSLGKFGRFHRSAALAFRVITRSSSEGARSGHPVCVLVAYEKRVFVHFSYRRQR